MTIFILTVILSALMAIGLVIGIYSLFEYNRFPFKKYLFSAGFGFTLVFFTPFIFFVQGIERGFFS